MHPLPTSIRFETPASLAELQIARVGFHRVDYIRGISPFLCIPPNFHADADGAACASSELDQEPIHDACNV